MALFPNLMRMAAQIPQAPPVVLELAGQAYRDGLDAPMPKDAPRWILDWAAGRSLPIGELLPSLKQLQPAERAALIRFPLSAVLWCPCDCETCARWGVVLGVSRCERGEAMLLLRATEAKTPPVRISPTHSKLLVVAFRGELTRETMRAVLAPEGEA